MRFRTESPGPDLEETGEWFEDKIGPEKNSTGPAVLLLRLRNESSGDVNTLAERRRESCRQSAINFLKELQNPRTGMFVKENERVPLETFAWHVLEHTPELEEKYPSTELGVEKAA